MNDLMSPQEAEEYLAKLRRKLNEYNELRDETARLVRLRFQDSPELARTILAGINSETKALEAHAKLRRLVRLCEEGRTDGRRGNSALTTEGLSDLGILPLVAVAGGALATTELFSWLAERERSRQAELTGSDGRSILERLGLRMPIGFSGVAGKVAKVAVVAALAYVAWRAWQWHLAQRAQHPQMQEPSPTEALPSPDSQEEVIQ